MAARTLQQRFGSFVLGAVNGITVEQWPSRIQLQADTQPRVQGDGSVLVRRRAIGQQFSIAGGIIGVDTGEIRDRIDALYSALVASEDYLSLYADRRVRCALSDFRYERPPGTPTAAKWSATFLARWPYWESPTVVQSTHTALTGVGPFTIALASNSGTAPTWPIIRITNKAAVSIGPIVLSVSSVISTKTLQLGGLSLISGQQVFVDMREGRVGDGIGTPARPSFLDGTFWSLANGVNTIELAHNIGASASLELVATWYPAFWTL